MRHDELLIPTPRPTPRRARGPSLAKTAATRRDLADAALREFLANGYAGARMIDIARRAGVAKGTAYLHFPDKESLFSEVVRGFLVDLVSGRRFPRPKLNERTDDFFRRTLLPMVGMLQTKDGWTVLCLVIAEGGRFPELARAYLNTAVMPILRMLAIYGRRAERRAEIPIGTLSSMPIFLLSPILVGAVWNDLVARQNPMDIAAFTGDFLNLVFPRDADRSGVTPPS